VLYGKISTGATIVKVKRAIQSLPINELEIEEIYGFGSFFKGELFNDIDLVVIVHSEVSRSINRYYKIKAALDRISREFNAPIHATFLTRGEFVDAPLRDKGQLILIHNMT
jgi:predicted nucleotidyltransferase